VKNCKSKSAGFTLVELMVVIVIIAVLAGVVVVNYAKTEETVIPVRVKHDFKTIGNAITMFKLHTGRYPEKLDELMFAEDIRGWRGPYLENPPLDQWKQPYIYEYTGDSPKPYVIKTLGADGEEGGDDKGRFENKDYSSLDIYEEYAAMQN
jgi:general secretion pathway protein G